jgi:hypothetical protein
MIRETIDVIVIVAVASGTVLVLSLVYALAVF